MAFRLRLKYAIILVVILWGIVLIPAILSGSSESYSQAGSKSVGVAAMSFVILLIGTWDEYNVQKEQKK